MLAAHTLFYRRDPMKTCVLANCARVFIIESSLKVQWEVSFRNKYHLAQCKNSCQTRLLLRVGLYLCVCTHVLLMCLFKILLFRGINETMKTHKIKVTGVENIVDIYNRNSFFFCPVLELNLGPHTYQANPLPLSYTTPAPNAIFLTVHYQGTNFISRMPQELQQECCVGINTKQEHSEKARRPPSLTYTVGRN